MWPKWLVVVKLWQLAALAYGRDTWHLHPIPLEMALFPIGQPESYNKPKNRPINYPPVFQVITPPNEDADKIMEEKHESYKHLLPGSNHEWEETDEWFLYGNEAGMNDDFAAFDVFQEYLFFTDGMEIKLMRLPHAQAESDRIYYHPLMKPVTIVPGNVRITLRGFNISSKLEYIKDIRFDLREMEQDAQKQIFNNVVFPEIPQYLECIDVDPYFEHLAECYLSFYEFYKDISPGSMIVNESGQHRMHPIYNESFQYYNSDLYKHVSRILSQYSWPQHLKFIPETMYMRPVRKKDIKLKSIVLNPVGRSVSCLKVVEVAMMNFLIWCEWTTNTMKGTKLTQHHDIPATVVGRLQEKVLLQHHRGKFISQFCSVGEEGDSNSAFSVAECASPDFSLQNYYLLANYMPITQFQIVLLQNVDGKLEAKVVFKYIFELNLRIEGITSMQNSCNDTIHHVLVTHGYGDLTEFTLEAIEGEEHIHFKVVERDNHLPSTNNQFLNVLQAFHAGYDDLLILHYSVDEGKIILLDLFNEGPVYFEDHFQVEFITQISVKQHENQTFLYIGEKLRGISRFLIRSLSEILQNIVSKLPTEKQILVKSNKVTLQIDEFVTSYNKLILLP